MPSARDALQATSAGAVSRLLTSPTLRFFGALSPRRPQHLHRQPHDRFGKPILHRECGIRRAGSQRGAATEHPVQRAPGRFDHHM